MNGGSVCWHSQKQKTVSLSTTEAEFIGLSCSLSEMLWVKGLLQELEFKTPETTILYGDNQGAINLSKNPMYHSRTKHIDIRHKFITDHTSKSSIKVEYLNSNDMIADIFTKNLNTEKFRKHRQSLGIQDL
jgi:hypothetical protein